MLVFRLKLNSTYFLNLLNWTKSMTPTQKTSYISTLRPITGTPWLSTKFFHEDVLGVIQDDFFYSLRTEFTLTIIIRINLIFKERTTYSYRTFKLFCWRNIPTTSMYCSSENKCTRCFVNVGYLYMYRINNLKRFTLYQPRFCLD